MGVDAGFGFSYTRGMSNIKAVAYLRVSGLSQTEGDGFPRQQESIESSAAKLGYTITNVYREDISGAKPWEDRPVFVEMLTDILKSPDTHTIFVENMTRLAREYAVQENILTYFLAKNISLVSADTGENITEAIKDDPLKQALVRMQGIFAQLEKDTTVCRLRVARERKKAQTGRCEGQKPYGMLPGEETVLRLMLDLRAQGLTVREVTARLNEGGDYRTRNGRPWSFGSVARILARHEILQ